MATDILAQITVGCLLWTMKVLPFPLATYIARGCVFLVRVFMPRISGVAMRNLELVFPEKSLDERKKIAELSFKVLAKNIVYFAKLPLLTKEKAAEILDIEDYRKVVAELRQQYPNVGILVPTMHFGAFEFCVQCYVVLEKPLAILARGFGLPGLDRLWDKRRALFGCDVFSRKGGYKQIEKRLRSGQDVATLSDQNVKVNHAVFATFFGIPAATTKTIALASMRSGAPILFTVGVETSPGHYKLLHKVIDNLAEVDLPRDDKVLRITEDLHRASEQVIRDYPECWFWIHRRFKTRPAGEPEDIYEV